MRQLEVHLRPSERRMLLSLRDRPPSPRVGRRAMCLLLSAMGEPAKQIARITGLSLDAITDIRRRWHNARRCRLRSLLDQPRTGRPARVTPAYRRELRRALDKGPLAFGYLFTVWSIARLRMHLRKVTGITLNPNHAHALHRDLELAKPWIEVFWLPNYCWNLSLIERLWKHLKATRVANVLFGSYRQFERHVIAALDDFAKHPDLTLSIVRPYRPKHIRKNLVAYA